jgi:hypothetical protein
LVAALDDLSLSGPAQRAVRVTVVLAAALAWVAGAFAGAADSELTLAVLLLAAAWCVVAPDSHVGLIVPLAVGWQWWAHLGRTTSGWALLAAVALAVFHAATSLAATAPAAAPLGRDIVLPVVRRTAATVLVTAVVWAAVRWSPMTGRSGHAALTVAALMLLTLVTLAAAGRLRRPPAR